MRVRLPAVAGTFYPATKESLLREIERCFTDRLGPRSIPKVVEGPRKIVALICPHAGYMYSGPVAAHSYSRLAADGRPRTFVILGPNHTGMGTGVALVKEGIWRTPLGDVPIDEGLGERIFKESKIIDLDELAHRYEHSIEVQLPFLQYLYRTFTFVPIAMLLQDRETSRDVGETLATVLSGEDVVLIASTDFTHYEPHDRASEKDRLAIEAILKLDEDRFYELVRSRDITICGVGPVFATILAAKGLGARRAELLCYKTSGDVTGDYSAVVGYASIAIVR